MSSTKTPRAAPRDRSGPPAEPSAAALARSAATSRGNATKEDPWTRVQDSKLLKAYIQNKTGQALADAVGTRDAAECQKRLDKLVPKRLFIAYEWNESKPREHSEVFRAALPSSLQNMRASQLEKLWMKELMPTCKKAVVCVVNCGLGEGWTTKPNCARILGLMGLHPDFLKQNPRQRLTKTFADRRRDLFKETAYTRTHRETCLKRLAGDRKASLEDLNDDEFEKRDKRAYNHLRSKACCADAISDGANEATQMPIDSDEPEIAQRTINPPFEPVPVDAGLSNPAFARQFRRQLKVSI